MNRYPLDATFELTLRCNLGCKMCMFRRADQQEMLPRELSTGQWIDLAKQAAQAGTLNLLLTGGEPLMRGDFPQLYEGIYAQGFLLTLYTNGTLVTDRVMEVLQKMPPHRIGVTLYGISNADYAEVCGCKDGFDRAMEGLAKLMTLPSAVEVRFTPTRDTIGKFRELDKLVFDRFGTHVTISSRVFRAVRGGCMKPETCRPDPQQVVEATWGQVQQRLLESIPPELLDKVQLRIYDSCSSPSGEKTLLGCNAGMNSYTITWDGKLLGCQLLDAFSADALKEGLAAAWERFPETVKYPPHPCGDCAYLETCTLCPAVAVAETGSLTGVPEYICEITKETQKRKEAFTLHEKDIL